LEKPNLRIKINALLKELQDKTGVSDKMIIEFKELMELEDFSQEKE